MSHLFEAQPLVDSETIYCRHITNLLSLSIQTLIGHIMSRIPNSRLLIKKAVSIDRASMDCLAVLFGFDIIEINIILTANIAEPSAEKPVLNSCTLLVV